MRLTKKRGTAADRACHSFSVLILAYLHNQETFIQAYQVWEQYLTLIEPMQNGGKYCEAL